MAEGTTYPRGLVSYWSAVTPEIFIFPVLSLPRKL